MRAVKVSDSMIERAARLAEAITADPVANAEGSLSWTADDVMLLAIPRGLAALERLFDVETQVSA